MEKVTNVVRRGKIKIILYMFLCAAIVTGPLLIFTTKAAVLMGVADLFNVPANVAIKPDAAAPFAMDAGKKGVLFESQTEGAAVSLSSPVSGLMDISLRVYSEEDYSGDVLYAKGDPYVNRYLDLSELKIRLTDRGSGRFFDIILCGGQRTSVTVVSARVESGSSLTGSYYTADGIAAHPISTKWNTRGMFTQLGGTSFCNRVLFNGQISSSTKPVRIIFDPVTKCVYGYNYGISAAIEQKRLIADLSDSADFRAADLFEDGFDEYDVSFIFSQINYGKTGRFVLYSVSGQSFSGNFLTDSAGPMISASYPYNYYEGKKLPVSKPYGYAFIDGKISNINVRAYNPSNAEISLNSAAGTPLPLGSAWQESSYFIPQTAGSYAIVYSASDSSGIVGTPVRVELDVKAGEPPVFYDINNGGYEQNVQIGLGGNITVNGAVAYSGITKRNVPLPVDATVKRGGYEVAIFSGASDNLFTPDAVGTYDIIYTVKDHAHILTSETYTFTVSSTVAGYQFDGVIKDFYIAGESLTLPQAVVVFNGITYSGIGIAYAPSGKKYTFLKFVPDEIGVYNVVYSAVISGAVHSKHISFTVKNGSASMVTANSSFVTLQAGAKAPDYLGSYSGLLMSGTTDGASVTYKNIIDVSTKSATDPLIEILPIPPQKGVKALDKYTVTLTDIYDSKNFVRIEVTSAWINPHAVVKAGAGTQALTGLWNNAPQTSRTGGYLSWHSFSGEGPVNDESMRLSMDYATRTVHASHPYYTNFGTLVIGLADPAVYLSNTWKGFTTGECYLTLTMDTIVAGQKGELLILGIDGQSFAAEAISSETAPNIKIDTKGYSESNIPEGVVGTAYPIFPAAAYDKVDGSMVTMTYEVYFNYAQTGHQKITITNGAFTPQAPGQYTIAYIAVNRSGNSSKVLLTVNVSATLSAVTVTPDSLTDYDYFVGNVFKFPGFTAVGGSGNKELTVRLLRGAETVAENAAAYQFETAGTYTLQAVAVDFLGRAGIYTKTITVTIYDRPILSEAELPEYLLDGYGYVLPYIESVDYSSGSAVKVETEIYLEYKGVSTKLGADRLAVPEVDNSMDTVRITYRALSAAQQIEERTYIIPVIKVKDAGVFDISKFFIPVAGGFDAQVSDNITFTANAANTEILFANSVLASKFEISLNIPESSNDFSELQIILTDSADSRIKVVIGLIKSASPSSDKSGVSLNGITVGETTGSFYDTTKLNFNIIFDPATNTLMDKNTMTSIAKITTDFFGATFDGFPSGKLNVRFAFYEIDAGASKFSGFTLRQLNNQIFAQVDGDYIPPQIVLEKDINLEVEIGTQVALPKAIACDVLNPFTAIRVTIATGQTTILDTAQPEPSFTASAYGEYMVTYTATDGSGRVATIVLMVYVFDTVSPVITITGKYDAVGKVGKSYKLPAATVTDNYDPSPRFEIICFSPDGKVEVVTGGGYTLITQGRYIFRYFAKDANYNYSYVDIIVEVK